MELRTIAPSRKMAPALQVSTETHANWSGGLFYGKTVSTVNGLIRKQTVLCFKATTTVKLQARQGEAQNAFICRGKQSPQTGRERNGGNRGALRK